MTGVFHNMTEAQHNALDIVETNGAVYAGYNIVRRGARVSKIRIQARTILSLERLGFLTTQLSQDGGMMGVNSHRTDRRRLVVP